MISLKSWQAQSSNLQQSSCAWVLGLQVCHQAWLLLYFRSLVWTNITLIHHFTRMTSAGGPSMRQFNFLFVFNIWTSYPKYFLTLGGWIHKYGGLNVLIQALMWMNSMTRCQKSDILAHMWNLALWSQVRKLGVSDQELEKSDYEHNVGRSTKLKSSERVVHILYSWIICLVPQTKGNYSYKLIRTESSLLVNKKYENVLFRLK